MHSSTCEPIEPLLPAYAMSVLDEAERVSVETHLKTCESCRASYAELLETMAAIAKSSPQHLPSFRIEERLAAHVGAVGSASHVGSLQRFVSWLRGLFDTPRRWLPVVGTMLTLAVLVITGLMAEITHLSKQQGVLITRVALQEQAVMQYAQECTNQTTLKGTFLAASATAKVRFTPTEHLGVLEVEGLPPVSTEQTYQLWLIDSSGSYESGGLFQMPAAPNNQIAVLIVAPHDFKGYARFGVSVEPRTGSPRPTSPATLGSL